MNSPLSRDLSTDLLIRLKKYSEYDLTNVKEGGKISVHKKKPIVKSMQPFLYTLQNLEQVNKCVQNLFIYIDCHDKIKITPLES